MYRNSRLQFLFVDPVIEVGLVTHVSRSEIFHTSRLLAVRY